MARARSAGYRIITPSRFGYLGSPLPEPTTAAQADAFVSLFDALGIAQVPVLAFSAGSTSAVQFALRHPDRVSALVLVASNSPHEKPVTLAPRALARSSSPSPLWFLRVVLLDAGRDRWQAGGLRAERRGQAHAGGDLRQLLPDAPASRESSSTATSAMPRSAAAPSSRSPFRHSACTPRTTRSPRTPTPGRWSRAFPARAGCASSVAGISSSTTTST